VDLVEVDFVAPADEEDDEEDAVDFAVLL